MVAFRYEKWDEDLLRLLREQAKLWDLFRKLLLRANGEVERALRWLENLKEQGYLDESTDLEGFAR